MNVIERVLEEVDSNIIFQSENEGADGIREFFNKMVSMNWYAYRNQKMIISVDWPSEFKKINTCNVSFLEESWLFYQIISHLDDYLTEVCSDLDAVSIIRKKLNEYARTESKHRCNRFDDFVNEVEKTVAYDYCLATGEKPSKEPKIPVIDIRSGLRKIAEIVGIRQIIVAIMVTDGINNYEREMIADYLGYRYECVRFWVGNLEQGPLISIGGQHVQGPYDYDRITL